MNEETKEKTVNLEDLQAGVKQTFNKGFGNVATCSTAAATAAKAVTLGTTFELVTGATIVVTFTNGITVGGATLAVTHTPIGGSSTTEAAKPIYYRGAALGADMVKANDRLILRYNGTQFDVVGALGIAESEVDEKISTAINALDASVSHSAGADGLALSVTETNGKVTSISGSVAPNTYDAYGAASTTKSELLGDAATDYNTLGKLEDKIQAEATRAEAAEADRYTKSETYTKTEVNGLVDTPHQEYVTVDVYASLPATGSKDTIYRVSNYNGSTSQVDVTSYSEYAWNGSSYTFLCVKSQIGEVFDISVYNNNAKYADLAAALNGGANIPQSLQKGGMSVKFVQSSDNKYMQYRLMSDTFTTDVTQWQKVDDLSLIVSGISKAVSDSIKTEISFNQSGYITTTGEVYPSDNYVNTGLFPKINYQKLSYRVVIGGNEPSVTFYNENRVIIQSLSILNGTNTDKTIDLTDSKYDNVVYLALSNSISSLANGYYAKLDSVGNLNDRVESAELVLSGVGKSGVFNKSGYYVTTGQYYDSQYYYNCGKLPILSSDTIIKYRTRARAQEAEIVLFDESGSVVYSKAGTNVVVEDSVNLANYPTAKYFVVCVYTSALNSAYVYCYGKQNILEKVLKSETDITDLGVLVDDIIGNLSEDLYTESGYISTDGTAHNNAEYKRTPFVPYKGGTIIIKNTINGSSSAVISYYNENKVFISSIAGNSPTAGKDYILGSADIPSNTKFIRCCTIYDGQDIALFIKSEETNQSNLLLPEGDEKMKVLIFGDSITTCTLLEINSDDETTSYEMLHPSNSYVNSDEQRVYYDMWPYFVKQYLNVYDLRNYAESGAQYKDGQRAEGNERQNLSYQIEVAENDLTNPNNVFPTVGNFVPDIIIFALGTNDGNPNDTYESAMAKTVMNTGGTAVDIPATLANLDRTKFNEAVRYAFLKIKSMFPYAITLCVLPIQRAANNEPIITTLHEALEKMAQRHSIIVVDGAFDSGIICDNEVADGLGACLKDGLHPNEKGQNMMARMILNAIKNNWVNSSLMN